MSMTQIALLKKNDIPTSLEIEKAIQEIGYDFKILDKSDDIATLDGISCSIDGQETFFEIYLEQPKEIIKNYGWIKPDLTDQDTSISFIWGADYAAGACIGLISIALIDLVGALIYYLDDEMKYSREMLIADTPLFLNELKK